MSSCSLWASSFRPAFKVAVVSFGDVDFSVAFIARSCIWPDVFTRTVSACDSYPPAFTLSATSLFAARLGRRALQRDPETFWSQDTLTGLVSALNGDAQTHQRATLFMHWSASPTQLGADQVGRSDKVSLEDRSQEVLQKKQDGAAELRVRSPRLWR